MNKLLITGLSAAFFATPIFAEQAPAAPAAPAPVAAPAAPAPVAAPAAPTDPVERGKAKTMVCMACHGPDGNGNPAQPVWPKIAGQHPEYIYKQLMNFKTNERNDATMSPNAAPLSEDDMRDIAAYYGSLPQSPGEADAELMEAGRQIYVGGIAETDVPACSGCHGPQGLGSNPAKFPRISGQTSEYTDQTMKRFRGMERQNDPNGMMRGVSSRMTDAEIAAVSAYVEGLGAQ